MKSPSDGDSGAADDSGGASPPLDRGADPVGGGRR
jgi:hypothetical protein